LQLWYHHTPPPSARPRKSSIPTIILQSPLAVFPPKWPLAPWEFTWRLCPCWPDCRFTSTNGPDESRSLAIRSLFIYLTYRRPTGRQIICPLWRFVPHATRNRLFLPARLRLPLKLIFLVVELVLAVFRSELEEVNRQIALAELGLFRISLRSIWLVFPFFSILFLQKSPFLFF
jgi:hypothetical protein